MLQEDNEANDPDYDPELRDDSDNLDTELCEEGPGVYNMTPIRRTAAVASRLGVGNEALAKILTSHNLECGDGTIITEKKVRCQRSMVFNEAIEKRKGMTAYGKRT